MKTQTIAQKNTLGVSAFIVQPMARVTANDLKNAALIVSVFINVFIFTAWLTLQVTDRYNAEIISFLVR